MATGKTLKRANQLPSLVLATVRITGLVLYSSGDAVDNAGRHSRSCPVPPLGAANARGEQPRRANASQRPARLRSSTVQLLNARPGGGTASLLLWSRRRLPIALRDTPQAPTN